MDASWFVKSHSVLAVAETIIFLAILLLLFVVEILEITKLQESWNSILWLCIKN